MTKRCSMRRLESLTTRASRKALSARIPLSRIFALLDRRLGQAPPAGFGGLHGAGTGLGAGFLCDPVAGRRADGSE